jgi:hypothetical protein
VSARNEYVVVTMLEPFAIGQEFIDWPLHITIVPWFPANDSEKLDSILTEVARARPGFLAEVGEIEKLGPKKDVEVNLIKGSAELNELHWNIFNILEKNDFGIHQKNYVGKGYIPHVTHQSHGHASPGDKIQVKSFSLVKQVRQKKSGIMVKAIVKDYKLG